MSALTAAANDEDGDIIDQLRAENAQLRQSLLAIQDTLEMTARAGAAHARALAELEAQMEAVGAGGVGPLVTRGQAEQQATVKESLTARPAQPAAQWIELTDEDRQAVFESLPNALEGFLKLWGWLHFAKAIEAKLREKNSGVHGIRGEA